MYSTVPDRVPHFKGDVRPAHPLITSLLEVLVPGTMRARPEFSVSACDGSATALCRFCAGTASPCAQTPIRGPVASSWRRSVDAVRVSGRDEHVPCRGVARLCLVQFVRDQVEAAPAAATTWTLELFAFPHLAFARPCLCAAATLRVAVSRAAGFDINLRPLRAGPLGRRCSRSPGAGGRDVADGQRPAGPSLVLRGDPRGAAVHGPGGVRLARVQRERARRGR